MRKKGLIALSAALLLGVGAVTGLYAASNVIREDRTPPVITMESDRLEIAVNCSRQELMQGVAAEDNRDGDVTAAMVVEGISNISEKHEAKVTYAAFDSSGNVSKASRTLFFTDYEPPKFSQVKPLILQEGTNQDVLRYMTARDMVDGDLSGSIKGNLVSDTTSLSMAGTHQVEFRVTNSMGDTTRITLPVDVHPVGTFNSVVELEEYLIYLPVGTAFRPESFLKNLQIGSVQYPLDGSDPRIRLVINGRQDSEETPAEHVVRIEIGSTVDPARPGVYSVTYTVTMDNTYRGFARLNVVVEA